MEETEKIPYNTNTFSLYNAAAFKMYSFFSFSDCTENTKWTNNS